MSDKLNKPKLSLTTVPALLYEDTVAEFGLDPTAYKPAFDRIVHDPTASLRGIPLRYLDAPEVVVKEGGEVVGTGTIQDSQSDQPSWMMATRATPLVMVSKKRPANRNGGNR